MTEFLQQVLFCALVGFLPFVGVAALERQDRQPLGGPRPSADAGDVAEHSDLREDIGRLASVSPRADLGDLGVVALYGRLVQRRRSEDLLVGK